MIFISVWKVHFDGFGCCCFWVNSLSYFVISVLLLQFVPPCEKDGMELYAEFGGGGFGPEIRHSCTGFEPVDLSYAWALIFLKSTAPPVWHICALCVGLLSFSPVIRRLNASPTKHPLQPSRLRLYATPDFSSWVFSFIKWLRNALLACLRLGLRVTETHRVNAIWINDNE